MNAVDEKGRVQREPYRALCEACPDDWSPADQQQLRTLLQSSWGMHLVKWFILKEREALLGVAKFDLTTEEGRLSALRQQGAAKGAIAAVETIFDLTEVHENA